MSGYRRRNVSIGQFSGSGLRVTNVRPDIVSGDIMSGVNPTSTLISGPHAGHTIGIVGGAPPGTPLIAGGVVGRGGGYPVHVGPRSPLYDEIAAAGELFQDDDEP